MDNDSKILGYTAADVSSYDVGTRVGSSKDATARGTVSRHSAMGYALAFVDWDDGSYAGDVWRPDELRKLPAGE